MPTNKHLSKHERLMVETNIRALESLNAITRWITFTLVADVSVEKCIKQNERLMKKMKRMLMVTLLVSSFLCGGCTTLYKSIVTIKEAGDIVSREYAKLYNDGLITPDIHERAVKIDAEYGKAMGHLATVLESSKLTGNQAEVSTQLRAVKNALNPLIDIISSYVKPDRTAQLRNTVERARAK